MRFKRIFTHEEDKELSDPRLPIRHKYRIDGMIVSKEEYESELEKGLYNSQPKVDETRVTQTAQNEQAKQFLWKYTVTCQYLSGRFI